MERLPETTAFEIGRKFRSRQSGFTLMFVITAIALMAAQVFVLTDIASTMTFGSNTAYLQASERNLVASGLAWAKLNVKKASEENVNETIELDVSNLGIDRASLSVIIEKANDREADVRVGTSCTRGRRTLRHDDKYRIEL